jgi:hypothetical protein
MDTVTFDRSLASTYYPQRVVKQALLVEVPDGVKSTIVAEWDAEQHFVGSYYAVYDGNGVVKYGVAATEFCNTYSRANATENGWVKTTPILAYQYRGPTARVVTKLASGVVETERTITQDDWFVCWPNGEEGAIRDGRFRELYQV